MKHTWSRHKRIAATARRRALAILAARHAREFEILLDNERLNVDLPPADSKARCPDCVGMPPRRDPRSHLQFLRKDLV